MSSLHHRAGLLIAGLLGTSAVVAACAGSDVDPPELSPEDAGGDRAAPDVIEGGATDAGSDTNAPLGDACSSAGWCSIDVDRNLSFDDLWPLEGGSAVAIASRDGRSAVLVYEQSSWQVIHQVPFVLTSVWADSANVWVSGGEAGYVAHGHRDGADWKWSVRPISVQTPVTVIRKVGEHDLYALADARVWRSVDDGSNWAVDFGGDVPADETTLASLTATSTDDVWVTGARGIFPSCALVAHKSGGAWVTVVEGTPDPEQFWPPVCLGVGSAVPLTGPAGIAAATASNELVTFVEGNPDYFVARIRHLSDGGVDVATSNTSLELSHPRSRRSLWGASADDLYIAGFSAVRRGRNLWADGGSWEVSTVAREGFALVKSFNVVRGTRSDDVWLAGESYVFHKTVH